MRWKLPTVITTLQGGIKAHLLWPTASGWVALAMAMASLLIAGLVPTLTACLLSSGLWALLVASAALTVTALGQITVTREPTPDGVVGQLLPLAVVVHNPRRLAVRGLVVLTDCPFARETTVATLLDLVPGRGGRRVVHTVLAVRRGVWRLTGVCVRAGDPAGLFYRERVCPCPAELVVHPERVPLARLPLHLRDRVVAAPMGQAIGVSGQGQDLFGVREYRPTDGVRVVHWKASARHQRLMVREFEESTIHQVSILLDCQAAAVSVPAESSNFEYQVRVAASLLDYLGGMYCRVLFQVGSGGTAQRFTGPSQAVRHETALPLATVQPGACDLADLLAETYELISPNSIVYFLTLHEAKGALELLQLLLRQRVDVRWLHAPPALFAGAADEQRTAAVYEFAAKRRRLLQPVILHPRSNLAALLAQDA